MSDQSRAGGGFRSRSAGAKQRTPEGQRTSQVRQPAGAGSQPTEKRARQDDRPTDRRHEENRDARASRDRRGDRPDRQPRGGHNSERSDYRGSEHSDNRGKGSRGGNQRSGRRDDFDRRNGQASRQPKQLSPEACHREDLIEALTEYKVDLPRAIAYAVVSSVRVDDAFANLVLPATLNAWEVRGRDAAFATEITYGTLRALGVLDKIIDQCSNRDLKDIDGYVLDALRLGSYQILYTRTGAHGAVDTTVNIVRGLGQHGATGFANAILRRVSERELSEWIELLAPNGDLARLAFTHAHPTWIAESFAELLSGDDLAAALEADSARPIIHLAARPGELSAEELAVLTGGEEGKYSPYAVYLPGGNPGELEPIRQKMAAVQDEGSQLIARALVTATVEGTDNGRWLDLCAGPGGKTALIGAIAAIDGAHVDAVEVAPHRAKLVTKSTDGLPVTVTVADGRNPGLEPGYDRILVDAPCSGLGALRRRPEARWRKQESDIADLVPLQKELLDSAISLVRPGGVVVYSTCSPDLRETRAVVDHALASGLVEELPAKDLVAPMTDTGEFPSIQMWPHLHGTDGMFFAVLRKPLDEQN